MLPQLERTMSPGRRPPPTGGEPVGQHLRAVRKALGLTLKAVADSTEPRVAESYLSQIESGRIAAPAPQALSALARRYELDAGDVLRRAHYLPQDDDIGARPTTTLPEGLSWLPVAKLRGLDDDERDDLLEYLHLVLNRRNRRR